MKKVKENLIYIFMGTFMISFSQCSSVKELQTEAPISVGDVYCQSWVAGIEGGGGGLNIFIPTTDKSIIFEQVYFRGKIATLETKKGLYIGRFKNETNQPKDIVLNEKINKDKTTEVIKEKIPFTLLKNECVVSYKDGKEIKYFKIMDVQERETQNLYSAPPQKEIKFNKNH